MPEGKKTPLFVKIAWLNLILVFLWFLVFALQGVFSAKFAGPFAVGIAILLFADWAHKKGA